MNELLDKYRDKFGEPFPLMLCMGMGDESVCKIIKGCVENGKPYDPQLDPDAYY